MTINQAKNLQIFRLVDNESQAKDADKKPVYEEYKDSIGDRIEGTCQWFLEQPNFKDHWLKADSGILLMTADPGCGKSVLAKFLIDELSKADPQAAICYFFFKDPVQTSINQALCALLHQLFSQRPDLLRHAEDECMKEQKALCSNKRKLWSIFQHAIADKHAGQVICILDALDECEDAHRKTLTKYLKEHFPKGDGKLKVLLTSRPYGDVISDFNKLDNLFPRMRIKGEEEQTKISNEITAMIPKRVQDLEQFRGMTIGSLDYITKRLQQIEHRTYLWLHLVFGYLKTAKLTDKTVKEKIIENIPVTFNDAYEKILKKCEDGQSANKIFKILLAAGRTLTIEEMQLAFEIDETSVSLSDIDLEGVNQFARRLRDICGLFISIHIGKVYFIHQTARQFLLRSQGTGSNHETCSYENIFAHSISVREAHLMLAQQCISYIKLRDWKERPPELKKLVQTESKPDGALYTIHETSFHEYASFHWTFHVRFARDEIDEKMANDALKLCDFESSNFFRWFHTEPISPTKTMAVVCYFGMDFVVQHALVKRELDPELCDVHGCLTLTG